MPGENMPHFVPQHSGNLPFGFQLGQKRVGDKHLSPRQGKRINRLGVIQNVKIKLPFRFGGNALAERAARQFRPPVPGWKGPGLRPHTLESFPARLAAPAQFLDWA